MTPFFYDILSAFYELTGCPVIVNTSFNVRGEPIVCTPDDAPRCVMRTQMDLLVLENFLLEKEAQAAVAEREQLTVGAVALDCEVHGLPRGLWRRWEQTR